MSEEEGGDAACWAHLDDRGETIEVDLGGIDLQGSGGVVWSLPQGVDLNANLVHLNAGDEIGTHLNDLVDVVVVGQSGGGTVWIDGDPHVVGEGRLILVPKGSTRRFLAGPNGVTYLSLHRARPGIEIGVRPGARQPGSEQAGTDQLGTGPRGPTKPERALLGEA